MIRSEFIPIFCSSLYTSNPHCFPFSVYSCIIPIAEDASEVVWSCRITSSNLPHKKKGVYDVRNYIACLKSGFLLARCDQEGLYFRHHFHTGRLKISAQTNNLIIIRMGEKNPFIGKFKSTGFLISFPLKVQVCLL